MAPPDAPRITANVKLTIGGQPIEASITVPSGEATLDDLVPMARGLADLVVGIAEKRIESEGGKISCRAGCGACCRQLVPIAPIEARRIKLLVEGFPEPRRTTILNRFEVAERQLDDAGLLDQLVDFEKTPVDKSLQQIGAEYFQMGIACPFLENESCSIYEDRPIACREYLVTSEPAYCASPSAQTISMVPMPAKVSHALLEFGVSQSNRFVKLTALTTALLWDQQNREEAEQSTGPVLLKQFLSNLVGTGSNIPDFPSSTLKSQYP
jgi:Fe-S-cluster containining protein